MYSTKYLGHRHSSALLGALVSILIAVPAQSAPPSSPPPIIDVTGKLDPKFTVKLDPQDVEKLVQELKGLNQLPSRSIDINDLMRDGDEKAVQAASSAVSDAFLETAKDLLNLKAMAYKLAALFSLKDTASTRLEISQAYERQFQTVYRNMILRLGNVNPALTLAMNQCKSELCATKVFAAQLDLIRLAQTMNVGVNSNTGVPPSEPKKPKKSKMTAEPMDRASSELQFQSQITLFALEQTHTTLLNQHDDPSGFALMLNAVLSPFVQAGRTLSLVMNDIARCLNTPQLKTLSLQAKPVPINYDSNIQVARSALRQITLSIVTKEPLEKFNPFAGVWKWEDQRKKVMTIYAPDPNYPSRTTIKIPWGNYGDTGNTTVLPGKLVVFMDREYLPEGQRDLWLIIETTSDPNLLKGTYPVLFKPESQEITIPTDRKVNQNVRITRLIP